MSYADVPKSKDISVSKPVPVDVVMSKTTNAVKSVLADVDKPKLLKVAMSEDVGDAKPKTTNTPMLEPVDHGNQHFSTHSIRSSPKEPSFTHALQASAQADDLPPLDAALTAPPAGEGQVLS